VAAALQSPIEYQKEKGGGAGSSASLTRNSSTSGSRPAPPQGRPSSAIGLVDKEAERGRSQMRVSTSNGGGSTCFRVSASTRGFGGVKLRFRPFESDNLFKITTCTAAGHQGAIERFMALRSSVLVCVYRCIYVCIYI